MKKYIITITFLVSAFTYSQSIQKNEFLNDYAVCTCLAQGYHKIGIKLNDSSSNYWREATFLSIKQDNNFNDFISNYLKKMPLNQAYDGSTCVINYCLSIKEDKEFVKLKLELLKDE